MRHAEHECDVALGLTLAGSPDNHTLPLGFVVPATLPGPDLLESDAEDLGPALDGRDGESHLSGDHRHAMTCLCQPAQVCSVLADPGGP